MSITHFLTLYRGLQISGVHGPVPAAGAAQAPFRFLNADIWLTAAQVQDLKVPRPTSAGHSFFGQNTIYVVSIRHFLTLYSVNNTLFDAI